MKFATGIEPGEIHFLLGQSWYHGDGVRLQEVHYGAANFVDNQAILVCVLWRMHASVEDPVDVDLSNILSNKKP